jgi:hypothetical protein
MKKSEGETIDVEALTRALGAKDREAYNKIRDDYSRRRRQRLIKPLPGRVEVIGIYPVKAPEPCHLLELRMLGIGAGFDFGSITQPRLHEPRPVWQVPWDEVLLDEEGRTVIASSTELADRTSLLIGNFRVAFFMHYLDLSRPLISPFGDIPLPAPGPKPSRLSVVRYHSPG